MGRSWSREANRSRQARHRQARKDYLTDLEARGLTEVTVVVRMGQEDAIRAAAAHFVERPEDG